MTVCENNIYIHCSQNIKDHILYILENNTLLFQAFIPLFNNNKLEFYGTDSDVYIENVLVEESDILHLTVYTHYYPCIPFCNKLATLYDLNLQNVYYNAEADLSGKWQIYRNQIIFNEQWNYIQGLYFTDIDLFWEKVQYHELDQLLENGKVSQLQFNHLKQEFLIKKMDNMSF